MLKKNGLELRSLTPTSSLSHYTAFPSLFKLLVVNFRTCIRLRRGSECLILTLEEIRKKSATCWFCRLVKFSIHAQYPITITNDQDDATFPQGFQFYRAVYILWRCRGYSRGLPDCRNDAGCERMVCNCLQDMNIQTENPKVKVYAYLSRGPNKGCLQDAIRTA